MTAIFLKILNMSVAAGWMLLAALLLRPLLKKAPAWITCALWGLAALRLVCPFSPQSAFSLLPSAETVPADIVTSAAPEIRSGIAVLNNAVNPVLTQTFAPAPEASVHPLRILLSAAAVVWLCGVAVLLLYAGISCYRLKKTVRSAVPLRGRVLRCGAVDTPFILGVLRPRIYVPADLDGETLDCVLAHEEAHLRRRDHLWKPLGFLILSVHWFNPLCWLAYYLFCRDTEAACDERAVRDMDRAGTAAYTQALLDCSVSKRAVSACPLAFGETGVRQRIRRILRYKKPALWIVFLSLLLCAVLSGCLLTDPIPERNGAGTGEESSADESDLRAKYPEYFGLSTKKGLKVYIWQMAPESFSCGLLPGNASDSYEVLWNLKGATVEEMKAILATYGLPAEKIRIIPYQMPHSSYAYMIDEAYERALRLLFFPEAADAAAEEIAVRSTVVPVGWASLSDVVTPGGCLNLSTFWQSAIHHLPVFKIRSTEGLERFRQTNGKAFSFPRSNEKEPSFDDLAARYDADFFLSHTLLLAYVEASSDSYRYGVQSVLRSGDACCMYVAQLNRPETYTADMAGWLAVAEIPNEKLSGCVVYDAQLTEVIE